MMAVSFLPLAADSSDGVLSGDGTYENPYYGTVTKIIPFGYYSVGTQFDIYYGGYSVTITPGFGLEWSDTGDVHPVVNGRIASTGICTITFLGDDGFQYMTIAVPYEFDGEYVYGDVTGTPENILGLRTLASDTDVQFALYDEYGNQDVYPRSEFEMSFEGYFEILTGESTYSEDYWNCYQRLFEYSLAPGLAYFETNHGTYRQPMMKLFMYDLDGEITGMSSSWVPTIFVVDGYEWWRIVEVSEIYNEVATQEIPEPTKEGYVFTGWYEDEECTIQWTEESMLSAENWSDSGVFAIYNPAHFLFAGWEPDPSATPVLDFLSDPGDGDIQYVG